MYEFRHIKSQEDHCNSLEIIIYIVPLLRVLIFLVKWFLHSNVSQFKLMVEIVSNNVLKFRFRKILSLNISSCMIYVNMILFKFNIQLLNC